ncbi:MAG TPA: hypothetical protein QF720_05225 [Nitrospinota bacterium]|nr:hypothetical protein [Nitrospinota bacterium]|tara:strand:- start:324222 stop:324980 length:759 start_codon:yes stop_codon:yes gene_type:complete
MKNFKTIIVFLVTLLLALNNASSADFITLADKAFQGYDNKTAMKLYKKALKDKPSNFTIKRKLIEVTINVGEDLDNEQSEEYFKEAISMAKVMVDNDPDRAWPYYLVGLSSARLASSKSGKEKVRLSRGIEENAKKAIKINPKFYRAYILLGGYYREIANLNLFLKAFANVFFGGLPDGTNEKSVSTLIKSLEIGSGLRTSIFFELGKTYEAMGNRIKAIEYFQKTVNSTKSDHLDDERKKVATERLTKLKQ